MIKTLFFKLYVIALMVLVVWAARFIYPLIYWEFELTGEENQFQIDMKDPPLSRMRQIRNYLDQSLVRKTIDLGDIKIDENYEPGHFHHMGQVISQEPLNGCDYCHSHIPHQADKEERAFLNMHGFFLGCEVCHFYKGVSTRTISYTWIRTSNREIIQRPIELIKAGEKSPSNFNRARGNYAAKVIPWINTTRNAFVILDKSSIDDAEFVLNNFDDMSRTEINENISEMHRDMTNKPYKCDACHTDKNAVFPYRELGYSSDDEKRLMDIAIASVIEEYNKFHFPNLFIRKDDRVRSRQRREEE